ncbi:DNA-deoxyinosine glycosylase [Azovibrio restrictus]|uniref:DNA-deoxyinosine glycosylase n=1 Tax=Azovibrio restrictus TaxID=146938 RepID=UPI0026F29E83|nr:DNA-deoxyinosine glycosylase [Azovibrio restrictus]
MAKSKASQTAETAAGVRLTGLAPICDARIRLLILGSFPSPASLRAQQYYGHRQNHFWKLVGAILGEPLFELPYPERTVRVLERGVGIWDVYQACIRPGALDADIRAGEPNDLAGLVARAPGLRRVCFNGQTAGRFAPQLERLGLETRVLPSSSPACTLPFARKLEQWRAGMEPVLSMSVL